VFIYVNVFFLYSYFTSLLVHTDIRVHHIPLFALSSLRQTLRSNLMLNLLRNRFATTNSSTLLRSLSSVASRSSVSAFAARQSPAIVGSRSFLTARGSSDDDSNDHRRPKLGSASSSVGSGSENGRQFKRMIEAGEYDEVIDRFGELSSLTALQLVVVV
jgi:hypothetical protein